MPFDLLQNPLGWCLIQVGGVQPKVAFGNPTCLLQKEMCREFQRVPSGLLDDKNELRLWIKVQPTRLRSNYYELCNYMSSYTIRSNYFWIWIFVHTMFSSIILVITCIVVCWLLTYVNVTMRAVVIAVRKIWVEVWHILGQVTWQSLTHQDREFPCEMNAAAVQCYRPQRHSRRMEPGGFNSPRFLIGFYWLLIGPHSS